MQKKNKKYLKALISGRKGLISFFPLILSFIFIFGWWFCAFKNTNSFEPTCYHEYPESVSLSISTQKILTEISQLDRNNIQQALAGNFKLMSELIQQWETDAQYLSNLGIPGIKKLSEEDYSQACLINQILNHYPVSIKNRLNESLRIDFLINENKKKNNTLNSFQRFLPQSYVSASFLLAIAPSEEIIAIPKGLRYLQNIYEPKKLGEIPENSHEFIGEKLNQYQPDLIFTAPYSHPPLIETFKRQKINFYTLPHENTLNEIKQSLLKVGHLSNHILEAQLLFHFIEACFLTIDNRLLALNHFLNDSKKSLTLICLNFHQSYELPTSKSLIGQLLKRALSLSPCINCNIPENQYAWSIPTNLEKIHLLNPHAIFISTPLISQHEQNKNHFALKKMNGSKNKKIVFFDHALFNSANQYVALAYFDLYKSLQSIIL